MLDLLCLPLPLCSMPLHGSLSFPSLQHCTCTSTGLSLPAWQVLVMSAYMTPNQDMAFVTAVSYVTLGSVVAGFMCRISNMVRAAPSCRCPAPQSPSLELLRNRPVRRVYLHAVAVFELPQAQH